MNKETLGHYGWIVVVVIIIAILLGCAASFATGLKINFIGITNKLTNEMEEAFTETEDPTPGLPDNYKDLIPGLYETGTDYLLKPWDELIDEGILSVTDGALHRTGSYDAYGTINPAQLSLPQSNLLTATYATIASGYLTGYLVVAPGVTEIAPYGFTDTLYFTGMVMPASVTKVGESSFMLCPDFSFVVFGDNLETIETSAFAMCTDLVSVSLPATVKNIGQVAFAACESLSQITIHEDNPYYSSKGNCIVDVASKSLISGSSTTVIPDDGSVTTIAAGAFYSCPKLKTLDIPASVTVIEEMGMVDCGGLKTITVDPANPVYSSKGNCLIETSTQTLLLGSAGSVIPTDGSVTSIADNAFYNCVGLKSLHIPAAITAIPETAFVGCTGLADITADNGPTYKAIGNCLIDIASQTIILACKNSAIPNDPSVTALDATAFYGCSSLKSITIPGNIKVITQDAFSECTSLTSVVLESGVEEIDAHAFKNCTSLTSVTFGDTITTINGYAFEGCPISEVYIPKSVTSLDAAFIPKKLDVNITIDTDNPVYYVEGNCIIEKSTKTVIAGYPNSVIPNDGSVVAIGAHAFSASTATAINIPSTVQSIGTYAFYSCNGLKNVILPQGITVLESCVFNGCEFLESVTIPASVTEIKSGAFSVCPSLANIHFEGTKAQWNAITRANNWNKKSAPVVIHCSDGDI